MVAAMAPLSVQPEQSSRVQPRAARDLITSVLVCWLALASSAHAQAAATTPPAANGGAMLMTELAAVQAERADTSRLWPGLMVGVGSAGLLSGAGIGLGYVLSCHSQDCHVPAWVAVTVVLSGLLAAPGAVWLVHTNHKLSQLDMKISMLQQEIERFHVRSALDRRELASAAAPTMLTWRWEL